MNPKVLEFRNKLAKFRQAREQIPDLSYWDFKSADTYRKDRDYAYNKWKDSLPTNLKEETEDYDLYGAYNAGLNPVNVSLPPVEEPEYHLNTRDPRTGRILKSSNHPTFDLGLEYDLESGYNPIISNQGEIYTVPAYEDGTSKSGYDPKQQAYVIRQNQDASWQLPEIEITPRNIDLASHIVSSNNRLGQSVGKELSYNTPVLGDALTIKDIYDAATNRDWINASLMATGLILPFGINKTLSKGVRRPVSGVVDEIISELPKTAKSTPRTTVKRPWGNGGEDVINAIRNKDLQLEVAGTNGMDVDTYLKFSEDRNRVYESINGKEINKAKQIDSKYGTDYASTMRDMIDQYNGDTAIGGMDTYYTLEQPIYNDNMSRETVAMWEPYTGKANNIQFNPNIVKSPEDIYDGLVRHELGHRVDMKATPSGNMKDNKFLNELTRPTKFRDYDDVISKFKDAPFSKDWYKSYLRKGTEMKNHFNQFKDYLRNRGVDPNSFDPSKVEDVLRMKEYIDGSGSSQTYMKLLFDSYKNKKTFIKDFNLVPIVNKPTKKKERLV